MSNPVVWVYVAQAVIAAVKITSGAIGGKNDATAELNVANANARTAAGLGALATHQERIKTAKLAGEQIAQAGESGSDIGGSGAFDAIANDYAQGELRAQVARFDGLQRFNEYVNRANAAKRARAAAPLKAFLGGASQLIGGIGGAAGAAGGGGGSLLGGSQPTGDSNPGLLASVSGTA